MIVISPIERACFTSSSWPSFNSAPDCESPTDADSDNDYTLIVRATDSARNFSDQTVTIYVTNLNEIQASSSDDALQNTSTNDSIDAGSGSDTVIYSGNFSDYSFKRTASSLELNDQKTDTLSNVE